MPASLSVLGRDAHMLAIERAENSNRWNAAYLAALHEIGFDLVPVTREAPLGEDGPPWAPMPADDDEPYAYPCVIAPIGWTPPHAAFSFKS